MLSLKSTIAAGLVFAFGLIATVANAQGGYGALSYFDWSAQEAGLSKIESEYSTRTVLPGVRGRILSYGRAVGI